MHQHTKKISKFGIFTNFQMELEAVLKSAYIASLNMFGREIPAWPDFRLRRKSPFYAPADQKIFQVFHFHQLSIWVEGCFDAHICHQSDRVLTQNFDRLGFQVTPENSIVCTGRQKNFFRRTEKNFSSFLFSITSNLSRRLFWCSHMSSVWLRSDTKF